MIRKGSAIDSWRWCSSTRRAQAARRRASCAASRCPGVVFSAVHRRGGARRSRCIPSAPRCRGGENGDLDLRDVSGGADPCWRSFPGFSGGPSPGPTSGPRTLQGSTLEETPAESDIPGRGRLVLREEGLPRRSMTIAGVPVLTTTGPASPRPGAQLLIGAPRTAAWFQRWARNHRAAASAWVSQRGRVSSAWMRAAAWRRVVSSRSQVSHRWCRSVSSSTRAASMSSARLWLACPWWWRASAA